MQERKGKSGQAARKKSPYVHAQQLSFLEDTLKNRLTTNSIANEEESLEAENPEDFSTPSSSRRNLSTETSITTNIGKKRRLNPVETKLIEALDKKAEEHKKKEKINEDDDRLFLLSLLPSLKSIPPHFKLSARMDIMQSINKYFIPTPTTTCSSKIPYHAIVPSTSSRSSNIPYQESVPSTSYQPSNSFQSQTQQQMEPQSQNIYEKYTTLLTKRSTENSQANLELQSQLSPAESIQSYITNFSAEDEAEDSQIILF